MEKLSTKKYKSNILKIFVLYGLAGLAFFYGPVLIFYLQHNGMSFLQIGIITSSMLISTLLFEVPTGAFADLYGRKKSINTGLFLFILGALIIVLSKDIIGFILSSVFFGIGQAFLSGAWDALLYDSMKLCNLEKNYLKTTSMQHATFLVFFTVSMFFSPMVYIINKKYPIFISIFFYIIIFLFSLSLFEERIKNNKFSVKDHSIQMKKGFKYVMKHKIIIWMILFGTIAFSVEQIDKNITWAPYFLEKGLTMKQFGPMAAISVIINAIFLMFSHSIERRLKEKKSLIILSVIWITMFFLMYLTRNFTFVLFGALFGSFLAIKLQILNSAFNHHLHKKIRATVISIYSMVYSVVATIVMIGTGKLIDVTNLHKSILVIGVCSAFLIFITLFVRYNKKIWSYISSR